MTSLLNFWKQIYKKQMLEGGGFVLKKLTTSFYMKYTYLFFP